MNSRGISVLAAIAILLSLCACAGPEIKAEDVALEQARADADKEKVVAKAQADIAEIEAIGSLDPTQQGMAYAAKMMRDVVGFVLDKDNKKPMGFYEMKERIAAQQNALVDKTAGSVLKTSLVYGAIDAGRDVAKHGIDKAGDTVHATGDGSSVEVNRISSKSKTDTNQLGDNNSTGAVDASTTGPDKSSVTNNELAAEEPVVEEPEGEEGEFVPTEPPAEFDDLPIDIPEVPEEAK